MGSKVVNLRSAGVFGRTDREKERRKERREYVYWCVLCANSSYRVGGEVVGCGRNYMMDREGDTEEPLS